MTGYCKYCGTLTDDIIQAFHSETDALIWSGCVDCYKKRNRMMNNATVKE